MFVRRQKEDKLGSGDSNRPNTRREVRRGWTLGGNNSKANGLLLLLPLHHCSPPASLVIHAGDNGLISTSALLLLRPSRSLHQCINAPPCCSLATATTNILSVMEAFGDDASPSSSSSRSSGVFLGRQVTAVWIKPPNTVTSGGATIVRVLLQRLFLSSSSSSLGKAAEAPRKNKIN